MKKNNCIKGTIMGPCGTLGNIWELAHNYKTLGNSSILKLKFIFNYVQKD